MTALAAQPIPRVPAPSPRAFLRDYVARRRPVVLTGLSADWPALHRWTPDYLAAEYGDVAVSAAPLRDRQVVPDPNVGMRCDTLRFGRLVDEWRSGGADHYMTTLVERLPSSMQREVPVPPHCARAPWRVTKLWMGPEGVRAPLHWDIAENLHTVITGTKRFILYSPDDDANLYWAGLLDSMPNRAEVDPEAPDYERFPRFRDAQPFVADVGPGDTLFIPHRHWHHVRSLTRAITVNSFFAVGPWAAVVFAADLAKRVRGISR